MGGEFVGVFDDLNSVPAIALDYRFAGLVRLCGFGVPAKWIETRGTKTSYRGPVAIYATYGKATEKDPFLAEWFEKTRARLVSQYVDGDTFARNTSRHNCGKVVALATLSDVVHHEPWRATKGACVGRREGKKSNQWGWRMSNIWPLDPFMATPAPGFFKVSANELKLCLGLWFERECRELAHAYRPEVHGIASAMYMLHDHDLPGLGARWGAP
jgi:hypothetical protein